MKICNHHIESFYWNFVQQQVINRHDSSCASNINHDINLILTVISISYQPWRHVILTHINRDINLVSTVTSRDISQQWTIIRKNCKDKFTKKKKLKTIIKTAIEIRIFIVFGVPSYEESIELELHLMTSDYSIFWPNDLRLEPHLT